MGPLFNREAPYDAQAMAEAELQPPFARFHPVPTAPVFEPQYDYQPPQLMMVPVKQPHHRVPRLLSPNDDAVPTDTLPYDAVPEPLAPPANLPPLGIAPPTLAPVETARRAPNWRAGTIHKHRYAY